MPSWSEGGMILSLPDAISQIMEKHINREQPKLGLEFHTPTKVTKDSVARQAPQEVTPQQQVTPENNNGAVSRSIADYGTAPECPECGSLLEISEGCLKCRSCGYSKCS